jgi:hypothetical protein
MGDETECPVTAGKLEHELKETDAKIIGSIHDEILLEVRKY